MPIYAHFVKGEAYMDFGWLVEEKNTLSTICFLFYLFRSIYACLAVYNLLINKVKFF